MNKLQSNLLNIAQRLNSKLQTVTSLALSSGVPIQSTLRSLDTMRGPNPGFYISPQYRAPRNPIVLCHGLFGFDVIGPEQYPMLQMHYWRGIDQALKDLGCKLYITRVPSAGSIASRAKCLQETLNKQCKGKQLNFVAHSMGGLDCRYLASHLPTEFKILSLTTIATPHRGSPFMDWCNSSLGVGSKEQQRQMSIFQYLFKALDAPAFHDLSTKYLNETFNKTILDAPGVKYMSYAAVQEIPITGALWFAQQIVTRAEGPNDGLVSLKSAQWGELAGVLDCDHWDLVPSKVRKPPEPGQKPQFDAVEFYLGVATKLHQQGF